MTTPRVLTLDLETTATDAHTERCMSEPWDEASFRPSNGATKLETIARQKEEAEAAFNATRLERVDAGALSPRTGRVVCRATCSGIENAAHWAVSESEERGVLDTTWMYIREASQLVTFNGHQFDLPFLVVRSALLGIPPSLPANRLTALLRRYTYTPHADVRMLLCNWDMRCTVTLAQWAAAFGYDAPDEDGSQIGALHRAGDHAKIAEKCRKDVEITHGIYTKLQPFFGGA